MEYQKIEQGGEIVLSYCPAQQIEEVTLRYERDLPERMQDKDAAIAPAEHAFVQELSASAGTNEKRKKRRRKWVAVTALVLSLTVSLGCMGVGIWGISRMVRDSIPSSGSNSTTPHRDPSQDDDRENDGGEDSGIPDNGTTPSLPDSGTEHEGAPNFETYRPTGDIPVLKLVSVNAGQQELTAGEVYQKVSPSTVTVLGVYGASYSVGTGVIFTSDGYIMTNYHVIADCLSCEVWVTDAYGVDSSYTARFVGGDAKKDLAVIKIEASGLPAAEFGISSDLRVGDKVYAIGNPLGTELRSTFTDGIVSAVDRTVDVDGVSMTLIQTNTALNHGNSGGPLINAYGQVVGINTIKMMSGEDTIEGLGFAIPTSLAVRWVNDILTLGEIRPSPILGISVSRIPVKLEDGTEGLEVLDVTVGLGAYRAGIQAGDVLVAFNGVTVHRVEDIYAERLKLAVGDSVVVRVYRNGEYLDITMIMMAEPE